MMIGMCSCKQHGLTDFALTHCILSSCIGKYMTCMGVCLTINVIVAVIFLYNTNYSSSEENASFLLYFCPSL